MPEQKPECIHWNECNGCPLMNLSYEEQLKLKQGELKIIFSGLWEQEIPIQPSEKRFFYRGKLELAFLDGRLGFRKKDSHGEVFSVKECLLMDAKANEIVKFLEKKFNELGLMHYDVMKRSGFLRYVVLRHAKETGQFMVNIVSASEEHEKEINEIAAELAVKFGVESVNWVVNETLSDTAAGKLHKSFGSDFIQEKFLECGFLINHESFFQANKVQAEKLFMKILAEIRGEDIVLDVFCGIGAFTLPAAKKCAKAFGMEISEASVELARKNAVLNGVKNAEFIAGKARAQLKFFTEKADVVVLDPPRAGLDKKTALRALEKGARKVFYVSCNPETLARDLRLMLEQGTYRLEGLKAFDFFPQAKHTECLAVLTENV